ncbi:phospholipase D-like domain-containing protein [Sphingomonas morindae]|uniref:Phospholipase D n=1 Tax=Sphingomonas morindae TaxID=1541170 RepID=A0ABY4XA33_9SPHN|nr:phospholipase D-like domain-containing protein [Sphingomonas morindae]USI73778.1 phospholipase D-like domain-containing protein [Sphingomonas morindae]
MLEQGRNCWRIEQADRMAVIVDADEYFAAARRALLQARSRVMLIGWDFDARITLHDGPRLPGEPERVGEFLLWLVRRTPSLHLYLLRWDMGAIKSLFRGSTPFTLLRLMRHPRVHVKLDGHHPAAASHHQKIVVVDDCLAFCGGIDMTGERWDTRHHRDGDPRRVRPNGTPYKPWHDATTALSGPVARALGDAARDRWARATGERLEPVADTGPCWPEGLPAHAEAVRVAIARTHPVMADQEPVHEIEALFLDQIASARRWLYCESQYFASRRVAQAIARRLDEADGPEIVIVNPLAAQGWLEPIAMDTARARLIESLRRRDRHKRLALYHPFTAGGAPIYVHAKITVVDDRQLRIGSANLNNRSMRLDTECDIALVDQAPDMITGIRDGLIAEHLGLPVSRVVEVLAETGSLIATIERLRGPGRSLRPYVVPDLSAVETWLADNEVLDPEGPEESFEPLSGHRLFERLRPPPR